MEDVAYTRPPTEAERAWAQVQATVHTDAWWQLQQIADNPHAVSRLGLDLENIAMQVTLHRVLSDAWRKIANGAYIEL